MKQRLLSICMALALCLTLLPTAAWAAEDGAELPEKSIAQTLNEGTGGSGDDTPGQSKETPGEDEGDGVSEEPSVEGTGTAADPYQIDTAEELAAFRDIVNGSNGRTQNTDACAELTADIDLKNQAWTPIGLNSEHAYTGTFDGGGNTIEGLYVDNSNSETYAGLFGVVGDGGTVKNLTVAGDVTGSDGSSDAYIYTGGVAGENHGTVADCSFSGIVTGGDCYTYVGGVVGENAVGGAVKNCRNNGTVSAKGNSPGAGSYIGGVVGENVGTVADCCNTGAVTGSDGSSSLFPSFTLTGGVVGCNTGKSSSIKNCCNTGAVTVSNGGNSFTLTGGVVGSNSGGTVTNCRSSGDVTVTGSGSRTGGVAGESSEGTIENCYNTGKVTGSSGGSTGGVVGDSGANNTIKNCYNTDAVIGNSTYTGGVAGINDESGTISNCYYLTGDGYPDTGIGNDDETASKAEGKEKSAFESGEVAYLLNGEDADTPWHQNINKGTPDDYPVLDALDPGHGIVYQTSDGGYSNYPPVEPEPSWPTGGDSYDDSEPTYSPSLDVGDGGSIKVSPRTPEAGETVTITPTPEAGYDVGAVTVTDRNGREILVTEHRNSTYTFTQPRGRVTISVTFREIPPEPLPFTDVPEDYWAYDAIRYVYGEGLMAGTGAATFNPGGTISRQQVWMILARLDGADPADMAAARQWAMDSGISDGTDPGDPVTRQQLAALLYRFVQRNGGGFTGAWAFPLDYPDAGQVSAYAYEALCWMTMRGVITGTADGTLNPHGTATRAQTAVMLERFCELDK